MLKSIVSYGLIVYGGWGAPAFGVAQIAYGASILIVFLHYFLTQQKESLQSVAILSAETPAGRQYASVCGIPLPAPLPPADSQNKGCSKPSPGWVRRLAPVWQAWVEPEEADLIGALAIEGVVKHFITQGDRIVLMASASEQDKGLWAVVSNYGSLAPRLLFQSVEEAARGLFGKLAASNDESKESESKKTQVSGALEVVMFIVSLLGLLFVGLASNYTEVATNVLLGPKYPNSGTLLSYYCMYVFLMALNGTLESFVHAVAPHTYIASLTWQMALASAVFAVAASTGLRMQGGIVAVVLANCIATIVRIGFAWSFVHRWFSQSSRVATETAQDELESDGMDNDDEASRKDSSPRPRSRGGSKSPHLAKHASSSNASTADQSPSFLRLFPSLPTLVAIVAAFAATHLSWVLFRETEPWLNGALDGVEPPFGAFPSPVRPFVESSVVESFSALVPAGCGCIDAHCAGTLANDAWLLQGLPNRIQLVLFRLQQAPWSCRFRHIGTGIAAAITIALSIAMFDLDRLKRSFSLLREGRQAARGGSKKND